MLYIRWLHVVLYETCISPFPFRLRVAHWLLYVHNNCIPRLLFLVRKPVLMLLLFFFLFLFPFFFFLSIFPSIYHLSSNYIHRALVNIRCFWLRILSTRAALRVGLQRNSYIRPSVEIANGLILLWNQEWRYHRKPFFNISIAIWKYTNEATIPIIVKKIVTKMISG